MCESIDCSILESRLNALIDADIDGPDFGSTPALQQPSRLLDSVDEPILSDRNRVYDEYFHVERVAGGEAVLMKAVSAVVENLISDTELLSILSAEDKGDLLDGMKALLETLQNAE